MPSARVPPRVETIRLRGTTVSYIIRRHPRAKSLRITVTPFQGVVVTLPARLPRYINPEAFLREKQDWVLEQLARLEIPPVPQPLIDGSKVYYLGKQYALRVCSGQLWHGCEVAGSELLVHPPLDFDGDLKKFVLGWIKEQAAELIGSEAPKLARQIDVRYTRLSIRDQKTKWGSCSKTGSISLNWRLILFPPRILRYVIIHELCHLRHFNHSDRFWKLVAQHDADYAESVAWLREHGLRMESALR